MRDSGWFLSLRNHALHLLKKSSRKAAKALKKITASVLYSLRPCVLA
jgi:hypothetical protein